MENPGYFFAAETKLNYRAVKSSIADSMEGYKKVNPVDLIFLLFTVALFKISVLLFPITNFRKKMGMCTGI